MKKATAVSTNETKPVRKGRGSRVWTEKDRQAQGNRMRTMNQLIAESELPKQIDIGLTVSRLQDFLKKSGASPESAIVLERVPGIAAAELKIESLFEKDKMRSTIVIRFPSDLVKQ